MPRLRLQPSDIRDGATFWLARLWCLPAFGGPDYCPQPPLRDVEVDTERGVITFRTRHDAATFDALLKAGIPRDVTQPIARDDPWRKMLRGDA